MKNWMHDHLWRGYRRYLFAFVAMVAAGALGLAAASWLIVPTGTGSAFGKAQTAQGVALTTLDYSSGSGLVSALGPSQTGVLYFGISNSNTFPVTLTQVSQQAAAPITKVGDATCTAPASSFTLSPWTGPPLSIPASSTTNSVNGNAPLQMAITTGATFPVCLSGSTFSVPVSITGTP
jgi:hypothetical protein